MPGRTKAQDRLLSELNRDPVWAELMRDVKSIGGTPRFKPSKEKPRSEQEAEWIYRSGIDAGVAAVLAYLRYDG